MLPIHLTDIYEVLGPEGTAVSEIDANDHKSPASWEFSLPFHNSGNQDQERLM